MSSVVTLLNAITTPTTSTTTNTDSGALQSVTNKTLFQVTSLGGTGTTTVILEGSLDNLAFVPLATITLAAAATATDAVYIESLWFYMRARATSVVTGGTVTASLYRGGL